MGYAYKLFRVSEKNKGQLFPLFVDSQNSTPIGEWIAAKPGEKLENGKVKSKLGPLAYRPGWHLSDLPLATHIGVKGKSGKIEFINSKYVWCYCEYNDNINYQSTVEKLSKYKKFQYLDHIPENGFYHYKTSPNMFRDWIISSDIKIIKILSDTEVNTILKANNLEIMKRDGGDIDLSKFGF